MRSLFNLQGRTKEKQKMGWHFDSQKFRFIELGRETSRTTKLNFQKNMHVGVESGYMVWKFLWFFCKKIFMPNKKTYGVNEDAWKKDAKKSSCRSLDDRKCASIFCCPGINTRENQMLRKWGVCQLQKILLSMGFSLQNFSGSEESASSKKTPKMLFNMTNKTVATIMLTLWEARQPRWAMTQWQH